MTDDRRVSWLVIEAGWEVVAAGGEPVGRVDQVVGDSTKDIFDGLAFTPSALSRPKYVDAEHVGDITPGRVHLTLDREEAARLGAYDEPPPSEQITAGTASVWERIRGWLRG
jgi:hypothetical protein